MNQLILLPKDQFKKNKQIYILNSTDPRYLHIKNHLKLTQDRTLKMALLNEGLAQGKLIKLSDKNLLIEINSALLKNPTRPYREAIIGLGRPRQMLKILEWGTQLGINKFQIIKCQLSEKSYMSSPLLTAQNINETLIKALAQSAYYYSLPEVEIKKYFPRAWKENCQKVALDPICGIEQNELSMFRENDLQFLMGPERGFTDEERKKIKLYDFQFIKLGPAILKSEVAFNFFLGKLS